MVSLLNETPASRGSLQGAYAVSTVNGTAVNCAGYKSAIMVYGGDNAATGTAVYKVQQSADGSTGWTDVVLDGVTLTTPAIPATDDGKAGVLVISDLQRVQQYLRAVVTVAVAGPTVSTSAYFLLFGDKYTTHSVGPGANQTDIAPVVV